MRGPAHNDLRGPLIPALLPREKGARARSSRTPLRGSRDGPGSVYQRKCAAALRRNVLSRRTSLKEGDEWPFEAEPSAP